MCKSPPTQKFPAEFKPRDIQSAADEYCVHIHMASRAKRDNDPKQEDDHILYDDAAEEPIADDRDRADEDASERNVNDGDGNEEEEAEDDHQHDENGGKEEDVPDDEAPAPSPVKAKQAAPVVSTQSRRQAASRAAAATATKPIAATAPARQGSTSNTAGKSTARQTVKSTSSSSIGNSGTNGTNKHVASLIQAAAERKAQQQNTKKQSSDNKIADLSAEKTDWNVIFVHAPYKSSASAIQYLSEVLAFVPSVAIYDRSLDVSDIITTLNDLDSFMPCNRVSWPPISDQLMNVLQNELPVGCGVNLNSVVIALCGHDDNDFLATKVGYMNFTFGQHCYAVPRHLLRKHVRELALRCVKANMEQASVQSKSSPRRGQSSNDGRRQSARSSSARQSAPDDQQPRREPADTAASSARRHRAAPLETPTNKSSGGAFFEDDDDDGDGDALDAPYLDEPSKTRAKPSGEVSLYERRRARDARRRQ